MQSYRNSFQKRNAKRSAESYHPEEDAKRHGSSQAKKFPLTDIEDATLDQEFVKYVFKYDKRSEYCPQTTMETFNGHAKLRFKSKTFFLQT